MPFNECARQDCHDDDDDDDDDDDGDGDDDADDDDDDVIDDEGCALKTKKNHSFAVCPIGK